MKSLRHDRTSVQHTRRSGRSHSLAQARTPPQLRPCYGSRRAGVARDLTNLETGPVTSGRGRSGSIPRLVRRQANRHDGPQRSLGCMLHPVGLEGDGGYYDGTEACLCRCAVRALHLVTPLTDPHGNLDPISSVVLKIDPR